MKKKSILILLTLKKKASVGLQFSLRPTLVLVRSLIQLSVCFIVPIYFLFSFGSVKVKEFRCFPFGRLLYSRDNIGRPTLVVDVVWRKSFTNFLDLYLTWFFLWGNGGRFYNKKKLVTLRKTFVFRINVVERGRISAYGLIFFFRLFKTKRICQKSNWEFLGEHLLSCFERKFFFFHGP